MKQSLLIFSKYPKPGDAKTRLAGPLPPGFTFFSQSSLSCSDVARLSTCFIKDMLLKASLVPGSQTTLHYTPANTLGAFQKLLPLYKDFYPQSSGDLGERMQQAFQHAFESNNHAVILIGSDIPTLPPAFIRRAFAFLEKYPLTLGPCQDGGYYLIGLRAPQARLFQNIGWGSNQVFEQTLNAARALNLAVKCLPTWYDIDQPADLVHMAQDFLLKKTNPIDAPHTYALLHASGLLNRDHTAQMQWLESPCKP